MKKYINTKNLIILSIITGFFTIISIIYQPKIDPPKLILSSPTQNFQKMSVTEPVLLKFDKMVDPSLITIKSTPEEVWQLLNSNDLNTASFKSVQYLHADTKYSLAIMYEDQLLTNLDFKTIPQQGDPRYTQEVLKEMDRDYPLAQKLPLKTPQYRVVYSSPLTLEITLINPNFTSEEIIEEVKAWVTQNGGDVASHKFTIATP